MDSVYSSLAISLGLGLLVGLQREWARSRLAGVRTFPLITLLGSVAALLEQRLGGGGWIVAAGLLAAAAATAVGNYLILQQERVRDTGITTEVAVLVMYALGAFAVVGPPGVALAVGVAVAVLLQAKESLHGLAGKIGERDLRAIMLFAAISFVVLPVLPDRAFGPFGAINPYRIWLMVVLVAGMSLGGYIAFKVMGVRAGAVLGGLLGGLISSTATTVTYARRARDNAALAGIATIVIMLASSVVYARVLVEISVAGPSLLSHAVGPLGVMLGVSFLLAAIAWIAGRDDGEPLPEPENPTELKSALFFAGLYAAVLLAVAWGKERLGERGVFAVAGISGLTDMDAITLSTAQLVEGGMEPGAGWRAIVIAAISNTVFKTGIVACLGGRRLALRVGGLYSIKILVALALLLWWPR